MIKDLDYNLFFRFFDTFSGAELEYIDQGNPLLNELDRIMEVNRQFFSIGDGILLEMHFVSKGVTDFYGFDPETVNFGKYLTTTHPDDLDRRILVRTKLLSIANDLYVKKEGIGIVSTNFRCRTRSGGYGNILHQAFLFYSMLPYESVFIIMVQTDISDFINIHKGFHLYIGDDTRNFRYPDDELLMLGPKYSAVELKIIELITQGLSTKEIAQKLFRSTFTISTHRSNILKKSGRQTIMEVISDLKDQALL